MWSFVGRSDDSATGGDAPDPVSPSTTEFREVATGQLPDGSNWSVSAHRAGPAVCVRTTLSAAAIPPGDDCTTTANPQSAFAAVRTRTLGNDRAAPAVILDVVSLPTVLVPGGHGGRRGHRHRNGRHGHRAGCPWPCESPHPWPTKVPTSMT